MEQYTFKNQAFLIQQNPNVTEVHPFSYWKENGRRVKKGEKALRVWLPKGEQRDRDGNPTGKPRFIEAPVFDISQTETQEEYDARKESEAGSTIATAAGVVIAETRHINIS